MYGSGAWIASTARGTYELGPCFSGRERRPGSRWPRVWNRKKTHWVSSAVLLLHVAPEKAEPESGKIWWLKEVQYLQKRCHCRWTLGNLLQPLEFVPASRKHVVPTEWQVRSVLGDCISKAKVISIQASQDRQYALISDFLDLAKLRFRHEAGVTTNWIKDRPELLKLQNLAFASVTGPAMSSFPKNMTADLQYAINKCESLISGKQLILHGNPSAIARDFSPHVAVLRRHFSP